MLVGFLGCLTLSHSAPYHYPKRDITGTVVDIAASNFCKGFVDHEDNSCDDIPGYYLTLTQATATQHDTTTKPWAFDKANGSFDTLVVGFTPEMLSDIQVGDRIYIYTWHGLEDEFAFHPKADNIEKLATSLMPRFNKKQNQTSKLRLIRPGQILIVGEEKHSFRPNGRKVAYDRIEQNF